MLKKGTGSAGVGPLGDHPGVRTQSVGRDADPVAVPIRRLHGVLKDETVGVGGKPRLSADVQLNHRIAGDRHGRIEFHFDFNRVPELVGTRRAPEAHQAHPRRRGPATVHHQTGLRSHRGVDQIRVRHAVGG